MSVIDTFNLKRVWNAIHERIRQEQFTCVYTQTAETTLVDDDGYDTGSRLYDTYKFMQGDRGTRQIAFVPYASYSKKEEHPYYHEVCIPWLEHLVDYNFDTKAAPPKPKGPPKLIVDNG